jgi:hypothetical protein
MRTREASRRRETGEGKSNPGKLPDVNRQNLKPLLEFTENIKSHWWVWSRQ